jgi:16S rRNA (guanine527-N7)-methyltransferase
MSRKAAILRDRIEKRARRAGIDVSGPLAARLSEYVELLRHWNTRMNLTGLDEKDAGLDRLIIEPLVAVSHVPREGRAIDIGSGGGSPAIPLKLAVPGLSLLMVESKTRKAAFLREVCRKLEIEDVVVETGRYEELLSRPELHEVHDLLTLRAVRIEARVLRGLQAFVRPGGVVALFRGGGGNDLPADLEPPLAWRATYPLVSTLGSRLVMLEKRRIGKKFRRIKHEEH